MSPDTFEILGSGLFLLGGVVGAAGRVLYLHIKRRLAWRAIERDVIQRQESRR